MQIEEKLREYKKILTMEVYLMCKKDQKHRTQVFLDNIEGYSLDQEDIQKLNKSIQQSGIFDKIDDQIRNKSIQVDKKKTGYEKNYSNELLDKVDILNKTFQKLASNKTNNQEIRKTIFGLNQQIKNSFLNPENINKEDINISQRKRNITQYYNDLKKQLYQQNQQIESKDKFNINYQQSQNIQQEDSKSIRKIEQSQQSLIEIDQSIEDISQRLNKILKKNKNQQQSQHQNDYLLSERSFNKQKMQLEYNQDNISQNEQNLNLSKDNIRQPQDDQSLQNSKIRKKTTQILDKYSQKINSDNDDLLLISNLSFQDLNQNQKSNKKLKHSFSKAEQNQKSLTDSKPQKSEKLQTNKEKDNEQKIIAQYIREEQFIRQKYNIDQEQIQRELKNHDIDDNAKNYLLQTQQDLIDLKQKIKKGSDLSLQQIIQNENNLKERTKFDSEKLQKFLDAIKVDKNIKNYLQQQEEIKRNFIERCLYQKSLEDQNQAQKFYKEQQLLFKRHNLQPEQVYQQIRGSNLNSSIKKKVLNTIYFFEKMQNKQLDLECLKKLKKSEDNFKQNNIMNSKNLQNDVALFIIDQDNFQQKIFQENQNIKKAESTKDIVINKKNNLQGIEFAKNIKQNTQQIQQKSALQNSLNDYIVKKYLNEIFDIFNKTQLNKPDDLIYLKKELQNIDQKYENRYFTTEEQIRQKVLQNDDIDDIQEVYLQIQQLKKQIEPQQVFKKQIKIDQESFAQPQNFVINDNFYKNMFKIKDSERISKIKENITDNELVKYLLNDIQIQKKSQFDNLDQEYTQLYNAQNLNPVKVIKKIKNLNIESDLKNYLIQREKAKKNYLCQNIQYDKQNQEEDDDKFFKKFTEVNEKLEKKFNINPQQLQQDIETIQQDSTIKNYILADLQFCKKISINKNDQKTNKSSPLICNNYQIDDYDNIEQNFKSKIDNLPLTYNQKKYIVELQKTKSQLKEEIFYSKSQQNMTLQELQVQQQNIQQKFSKNGNSIEEEIQKTKTRKDIKQYLIQNKQLLQPLILNNQNQKQQEEFMTQIGKNKTKFLQENNLDSIQLKKIIREQFSDQELKQYLLNQESFIQKYSNAEQNNYMKPQQYQKNQETDDSIQIKHMIDNMADQKFKEYSKELQDNINIIKQKKKIEQENLKKQLQQQQQQIQNEENITDEYLTYKINNEPIENTKKKLILQQLSFYKNLASDDCTNQSQIIRKANLSQNQFENNCSLIQDQNIKKYLQRNSQIYNNYLKQLNNIQQENKKQINQQAEQMKLKYKIDSESIEQQINPLNLSVDQNLKMKQQLNPEIYKKEQVIEQQKYNLKLSDVNNAIQSLPQSDIKKILLDVYNVAKKNNDQEQINIFTQKKIFQHQEQKLLKNYQLNRDEIVQAINFLPINYLEKQHLQTAQDKILQTLQESMFGNEDNIQFEDPYQNLNQSQFYKIVQKIDNENLKGYLIEQKQILDCTQKRFKTNQDNVIGKCVKTQQIYLKASGTSLQKIIDQVDTQNIIFQEKQLIKDFLYKQQQIIDSQSYLSQKQIDHEQQNFKLKNLIVQQNDIQGMRNKINEDQFYEYIQQNNFIMQDQSYQQINKQKSMCESFVQEHQKLFTKFDLTHEKVIQKIIQLPLSYQQQQNLMSEQIQIRQLQEGDNIDQNQNISGFFEKTLLTQDIYKQLQSNTNDEKFIEYLQNLKDLRYKYVEKNKFNEQQYIKTTLEQQLNLRKKFDYSPSKILLRINNLSLEQQIKKSLIDQQTIQYKFPLLQDHITVKSQYTDQNYQKKKYEFQQSYLQQDNKNQSTYFEEKEKDLQEQQKYSNLQDIIIKKKLLEDIDHAQKQYGLSDEIIIQKIGKSECGKRTKQILIDNFIKQKFILQHENLNSQKRKYFDVLEVKDNIENLPENSLKRFMMDNIQILDNYVKNKGIQEELRQKKNLLNENCLLRKYKNIDQVQFSEQIDTKNNISLQLQEDKDEYQKNINEQIINNNKFFDVQLYKEIGKISDDNFYQYLKDNCENVQNYRNQQAQALQIIKKAFVQNEQFEKNIPITEEQFDELIKQEEISTQNKKLLKEVCFSKTGFLDQLKINPLQYKKKDANFSDALNKIKNKNLVQFVKQQKQKQKNLQNDYNIIQQNIIKNFKQQTQQIRQNHNLDSLQIYQKIKSLPLNNQVKQQIIEDNIILNDFAIEDQTQKKQKRYLDVMQNTQNTHDFDTELIEDKNLKNFIIQSQKINQIYINSTKNLVDKQQKKLQYQQQILQKKYKINNMQLQDCLNNLQVSQNKKNVLLNPQIFIQQNKTQHDDQLTKSLITKVEDENMKNYLIETELFTKKFQDELNDQIEQKKNAKDQEHILLKNLYNLDDDQIKRYINISPYNQQQRKSILQIANIKGNILNDQQNNNAEVLQQSNFLNILPTEILDKVDAQIQDQFIKSYIVQNNDLIKASNFDMKKEQEKIKKKFILMQQEIKQKHQLTDQQIYDKIQNLSISHEKKKKLLQQHFQQNQQKNEDFLSKKQQDLFINSQQFLSIIIDVDDQTFQQYLQEFQNLQNEKNQAINQLQLETLQKVNNQQIVLRKKFKIDSSQVKQKLDFLELDESQKRFVNKQNCLPENIYSKYLLQDSLFLNEKMQQFSEKINKMKQNLEIDNIKLQQKIRDINEDSLQALLVEDEKFNLSQQFFNADDNKRLATQYIKFLQNNCLSLNTDVVLKNLQQSSEICENEQYYLIQRQRLKEQIFENREIHDQEEIHYTVKCLNNQQDQFDQDNIKKKIEQQITDENIKKNIVQDLIFAKKLKERSMVDIDQNDTMCAEWLEYISKKNIKDSTKVIKQLNIEQDHKKYLLMIQQFKRLILKTQKNSQQKKQFYDNERILHVKNFLESTKFNQYVNNIDMQKLIIKANQANFDQATKKQVIKNLQLTDNLENVVKEAEQQYLKEFKNLKIISQSEQIKQIENLKTYMKDKQLSENEQKFTLEHVLYHQDINTLDQSQTKKPLNFEVEVINKYQVDIGLIMKKLEQNQSEKDQNFQNILCKAIQPPLIFLNKIQRDTQNCFDSLSVCLANTDENNTKILLTNLNEDEKNYLISNNMQIQQLNLQLKKKTILPEERHYQQQKSIIKEQIFLRNSLQVSDVIEQVSNLNLNNDVKHQLLSDLKQMNQNNSDDVIFAKNRIDPQTIIKHISNAPLNQKTKDAILQQQNYIYQQKNNTDQLINEQQQSNIKKYIKEEQNLYKKFNLNSKIVKKQIQDSQLQENFKKFLQNEQDVIQKVLDNQSLFSKTQISTYIQSRKISQQIFDVQPKCFIKQVLDSDLHSDIKSYLVEHFIISSKISPSIEVIQKQSQEEPDITKERKHHLDQLSFIKKNNIDIQNLLDKVQSSNIELVAKIKIVHDMKTLQNFQKDEKSLSEDAQKNLFEETDISETLDTCFFQIKQAVEDSNLDLRCKFNIMQYQQFLMKNKLKNCTEQQQIKLYLKDEMFSQQEHQINQEELIQKIDLMKADNNIKKYILDDLQFCQQIQTKEYQDKESLQNMLVNQYLLQNKYNIQDEQFIKQIDSLQLLDKEKKYLKKRIILHQQWLQLTKKDTDQMRKVNQNEDTQDAQKIILHNATQEQQNIYKKFNIEPENIQQLINKQDVSFHEKSIINDQLNLQKQLQFTKDNPESTQQFSQNFYKVNQLQIDENLKKLISENYELIQKYTNIQQEIFQKKSNILDDNILSQNNCDMIELRSDIKSKVYDENFKNYLIENIDLQIHYKQQQNLQESQQKSLLNKVNNLQKKFNIYPKSFFKNLDNTELSSFQKQYLLNCEITNHKNMRNLQNVQLKLQHVNEFEQLRQKYQINSQNLQKKIKNMYIHQNLKNELFNIQEVFDKKPMLEIDRLHKQIQLLPIQSKEKQYLIDCSNLQQKYKQQQDTILGYYKQKEIASEDFREFLNCQEYLQEALQVYPEEVTQKLQNIEDADTFVKKLKENVRLLSQIETQKNNNLKDSETQRIQDQQEKDIINNWQDDTEKFSKKVNDLNVDENIKKYLIQQDYFVKKLKNAQHMKDINLVQQNIQKNLTQQKLQIFKTNNLEEQYLASKIRQLDTDDITRKVILDSIQTKNQNADKTSIFKQYTKNDHLREQFIDKLNELPLQFNEKRAIMQAFNCQLFYQKQTQQKLNNQTSKNIVKEDQKLKQKLNIEQETIFEQINKVQDTNVKNLILEEQQFIIQHPKESDILQGPEMSTINKNFIQISKKYNKLPLTHIIQEVLQSKMDQNYKQYISEAQIIKQKIKIQEDQIFESQNTIQNEQQMEKYMNSDLLLQIKNDIDLQNFENSIKNLNESVTLKKYFLEDLKLKKQFLQKRNSKYEQSRDAFQLFKKRVNQIDQYQMTQCLNNTDLQQNQKNYLLEDNELKKQYFQEEILTTKNRLKQDNIRLQRQRLNDFLNIIQKIDKVDLPDLYKQIENLDIQIDFKRHLLQNQDHSKSIQISIQNEDYNQLDKNLQKERSQRQIFNYEQDNIIQKIKMLPLQENQKQYLVSKEILQQQANIDSPIQYKTITEQFKKQAYVLLSKNQIDPEILQQKIMGLKDSENLKQMLISDIQFLQNTQQKTPLKSYLDDQQQIVQKKGFDEITIQNQIQTMDITYQEKQFLQNLQILKKVYKKDSEGQSYIKNNNNNKSNCLFQIYQKENERIKLKYNIDQEKLQKNIINSQLPLDIKSYAIDLLAQNIDQKKTIQSCDNLQTLLIHNNINIQEFSRKIRLSNLQQNEKEFLIENQQTIDQILNDEFQILKQSENQVYQKMLDFEIIQQNILERNNINTGQLYKTIVQLPNQNHIMKQYLIEDFNLNNQITQNETIKEQNYIDYLVQGNNFKRKNNISEQQFTQMIHNLPIEKKFKNYILQNENLKKIEYNNFKKSQNKSTQQIDEDENQTKNIYKTEILDAFNFVKYNTNNQDSTNTQKQEIENYLDKNGQDRKQNIDQESNEQQPYDIKILNRNIENTSNLDIKHLISQRSIKNKEKMQIKRTKSHDFLYGIRQQDQQSSIQHPLKFEKTDWYKKLRRNSCQKKSKHQLKDFMDKSVQNNKNNQQDFIINEKSEKSSSQIKDQTFQNQHLNKSLNNIKQNTRSAKNILQQFIKVDQSKQKNYNLSPLEREESSKKISQQREQSKIIKNDKNLDQNMNDKLNDNLSMEETKIIQQKNENNNKKNPQNEKLNNNTILQKTINQKYQISQQQKSILDDFIKQHDKSIKREDNKFHPTSFKQQNKQDNQRQDEVQDFANKSDNIEGKNESKEKKKNFDLQNYFQFTSQLKKQNDNTNSLYNKKLHNDIQEDSNVQNKKEQSRRDNQNRHHRSQSSLVPKNYINFETFRNEESRQSSKDKTKKNELFNQNLQKKKDISNKQNDSQLQKEIQKRQKTKNRNSKTLKLSNSAKLMRTKVRKQKINAHIIKKQHGQADKINQKPSLIQQGIKKPQKNKQNPELDLVTIKPVQPELFKNISIKPLTTGNQEHFQYQNYIYIIEKFIRMNNLLQNLNFVTIDNTKKIFYLYFKFKHTVRFRKFKLKHIQNNNDDIIDSLKKEKFKHRLFTLHQNPNKNEQFMLYVDELEDFTMNKVIQQAFEKIQNFIDLDKKQSPKEFLIKFEHNQNTIQSKKSQNKDKQFCIINCSNQKGIRSNSANSEKIIKYKKQKSGFSQNFDEKKYHRELCKKSYSPVEKIIRTKSFTRENKQFIEGKDYYKDKMTFYVDTFNRLSSIQNSSDIQTSVEQKNKYQNIQKYTKTVNFNKEDTEQQFKNNKKKIKDQKLDRLENKSQTSFNQTLQTKELKDCQFCNFCQNYFHQDCFDQYFDKK